MGEGRLRCMRVRRVWADCRARPPPPLYPTPKKIFGKFRGLLKIWSYKSHFYVGLLQRSSIIQSIISITLRDSLCVIPPDTVWRKEVKSVRLAVPYYKGYLLDGRLEVAYPKKIALQPQPWMCGSLTTSNSRIGAVINNEIPVASIC